MLCQNQTVLGKTEMEIFTGNPATSLNRLGKMAVISGSHERRAGKWLRRWKEMSVTLTQLVTSRLRPVQKPSAHHLTQDPSDLFKATSCPPKDCSLSQVLA